MLSLWQDNLVPERGVKRPVLVGLFNPNTAGLNEGVNLSLRFRINRRITLIRLGCRHNADNDLGEVVALGNVKQVQRLQHGYSRFQRFSLFVKQLPAISILHLLIPGFEYHSQGCRLAGTYMATDGLRLFISQPAIGVKTALFRGYPQQQHIHTAVVVTRRAVLRHDRPGINPVPVSPPGLTPG